MAQQCPICEFELSEEACVHCAPELPQAHVQMLATGGFKLMAWPEQGLAPPEKLKILRIALLKENWLEAEQEWLRLIRGYRAHVASERGMQARAYAHLAALLEGLERGVEAEHMRARGLALQRGPAPLTRKSEMRAATVNFIDQIRAEEGERPGMSEEAKKRLDKQLAAEEKREKHLKVAGFTVAGLVTAPLIGLNILIGGALGMGLGGALTVLKR